jgi:AsmA protein
MSEGASTLATKAGPQKAMLRAGLALLVVVLLLIAGVAAPYVFSGTTLEGEVAAQLKATTGLKLISNGGASFNLLPTPHITLTDVVLKRTDGALDIAAASLDGEVRFLPMIVGRLELASATLTAPKIALDLDAGGMTPDSTIGRALHGLAPGTDGDSRLGKVSLVDGSAVIKTKGRARTPKLGDINLVIDWPDVNSPATLTGSLSIDGEATDVAAWAAQPSALLRGDTSPIALRVHAAPLDVSANGDLTSTSVTLFKGHMAMSAASVPALLARFGDPRRMLAPFANVSLRGDTTIAVDNDDKTTIDLQALQLDLDGNRYEGTLAYESGDKPSLSGTLATETLVLAPFLSSEPSLADAQHRWTRSALVAGGGDLVNFDLRLSATHLRCEPFTIDDAALSVMTRGPRTEISLNEGRAYGGTIKARASVGVANGIVSLRGAGTVTDADVAGLSWDALGRQVAAGLVSGSLNIDTSGDSPAALMAHLQGWTKLHAHDGEISGLDLGRGLQALAAQHSATSLAAFRRGRTPYSDIALDLRLADGVATIESGTMTGSAAVVGMTGTADIGNRGLDLAATAAKPDDPRPADALSVAIKGSFDAPAVTPQMAPPVTPGPH